MPSELERLREWVEDEREIAKLGLLCCAEALNEVLAEIDRMIAERVNHSETPNSCGEAHHEGA